MDIRTEFGQRVRELRARCGMSQEMLAHRAGLDRTYISGVERGERNISIVNIEKIASALCVSVEYLFFNERFSTTSTYQPKDF
ncbi:helix-turn-helix domain-containing protein [Thermicanus aegyptius]|uniref:helix-turn-helix domain-containing protein n=1 Tax=Thermicanus aegyptius TaxID=94009 RepID=UPI000587916D|nr:helix-turn-helix transcriptional regulator [Thermicanus aegyptius]